MAKHLTAETLSAAQSADFAAIQHHINVARMHERNKIAANTIADDFMLRLYESDSEITLAALADALGMVPSNVDKRLRRAKGRRRSV